MGVASQLLHESCLLSCHFFDCGSKRAYILIDIGVCSDGIIAVPENALNVLWARAARCEQRCAGVPRAVRRKIVRKPEGFHYRLPNLISEAVLARFALPSVEKAAMPTA